FRGNDEILDYGNLSGMIESIEKPQESIRKNRNPHRRHSRAGGNPATQRGRTLSEKTETPPTVIPAKAGIQKRNATGIYRKKQKPHRRHSRKSGNPKTQRNRNLSEKTETPPPSFPRTRESRPVGTESYRIKQFP
ncbi:TPA: hypothetical protein ACT6G7_002152, partial [Neisseria meningitidis]